MTATSMEQVALEPVRTYAGVPKRVLGYALDLVLLSAAVTGCAAVLSMLVGPMVSFGPATAGLSGTVRVHRGVQALDALVGLALGAAYFIGCWRLLRGSLGQRLLGIRLHGSLDDEALPLGRAALRWVLLGGPFAATAAAAVLGVGPLATAVIWLLIIVWYLVLLVTTARNPRRQGLHDRLARTVVVRRTWRADNAPRGAQP